MIPYSLLHKSGIYKISCGNRAYIGSSKSLYYRLRMHLSHLRRGKHHSAFMQRCYDKYGESSFLIEIIEIRDFTESDLRLTELRYIQELKPVFNSMEPVTYKFSEEMKAKISKTMIEGYKSGDILHPRLGTGRKYNVYNSAGDPVSLGIGSSDVVSLLKISNRSVFGIQLRARNPYICSRSYIITYSDEDLCEYVIDYYMSSRNGDNACVYRMNSDGSYYRVKYNLNRLVPKIKNSTDFVYYSEISNCYFFFGGLIEKCRSLQ